MKKNQLITVLRWIARIWGIATIAFLTVMFLGHVFGPGGFGTFNGFIDALQFTFYPVGVVAGLILAWKREGPGGFLTVGSVAAFHLLRLVKHGDPAFNGMIDGLATPGALFIACWLLSRNQIPALGSPSGESLE